MGRCALQRYPDTELNVEVHESVRGRDVYIIQPTSPPVDQHLMELLFLLLPILRFALSQKIEEESTDTTPTQHACDINFARAQAAASTSMCEQDDSHRTVWNFETPLQFNRVCRDWHRLMSLSAIRQI